MRALKMRSAVAGHSKLTTINWEHSMRLILLQLHAAAAKSLQLCPTLYDPIDGSRLGFSVPGILQARILEWVAISFSNAWKWKVKVKSLRRSRLLVTLLQPTRLLGPWDFPGKSPGVGCHCLLRTTTWEVAKELTVNLSMIIWNLKQIGKVTKLNKWVPRELTANF